VTVIAPVPAYAVTFLEDKTLETYYREESEKVFGPIRSFAEQQGWNIRLKHGPGHPAETIAALVESEHHDLVVMGTHGHSSLGNVVLGSVATGVLARCKAPVLLIR
jgi:nucleotide-binding universal stress UspA family protein